jgi:hypothetical protein
MADLDALMTQIPVGDIAERLGIDRATARAAVDQVVPGLVAGLAENAKDSRGAASLTKAVSHDRGRAHLKAARDIDVEDGKKIVKNVYGDKQDQVSAKLAAKASTGESNVTQDIIQKVLPIVAPIVLSWLASRFLEKKDAPASGSGGGIGDMLGGLLGGGSSSGGGIGDVLGGLLGGGKK